MLDKIRNNYYTKNDYLYHYMIKVKLIGTHIVVIRIEFIPIRIHLQTQIHDQT